MEDGPCVSPTCKTVEEEGSFQRSGGRPVHETSLHTSVKSSGGGTSVLPKSLGSPFFFA